MTQQYSKIFTLISLITLSAISSGCGRQAYNEITTAGAPGAVDGGTYYPTGDGAGTVITTGSSSTYKYPAVINGSGTFTSPTVNTDTVFKVTVRMGALGALNVPSGQNGYTIGYNCAAFNVTVGNYTEPSVYVLRPGYTPYGSGDPCATAKAAVTIDFGALQAFGQHPGPLSVTISNAMYDNCRLYGNVYVGGCTVTRLYSSPYSTHQLNAIVEIQNNHL